MLSLFTLNKIETPNMLGRGECQVEAARLDLGCCHAGSAQVIHTGWGCTEVTSEAGAAMAQSTIYILS